MTIDNNTGLVLEGGGMRGVFTIGVLDYFLDHDIQFHYNVGVSAGACNGLSYMSKQRGRAKTANIDLLEKYRYIGMKYLWTQKCIMDQDFAYDKITNEILPFNYDAYFANPHTFEIVTTNCITGKACYLEEKESRTKLLTLAKASSSLPFVCPIVEYDGQPMLDGGIADSIPIERSMKLGHSFNVIVTTHNYGYRESDSDIKIPKFIYRNYPRLRVLLSRRHAYYNRQLDFIEELERNSQVLIIRPLKPIVVTRLESDVNKLNELYQEGYLCAELAMRNIQNNLTK